LGKGTQIFGIIVGAFVVLFVVGYAYESSTGLNMLTGEKKTSGVGADKWTQTPDTIQQQTTEPYVPSTQTKKIICDPSYPTVCIPPWPPDLNCGEIQYANFMVLQPDPHGFDRDKDGIGCES